MEKVYHLPYRKNVAGVIFKGDKFLVDQLVDWKETWWKFPQGGVDEGESEEEAVKREIFEELGISNIHIIKKTRYTNRYDWPEELKKRKGPKWEARRRWRGQEQSFFLVEFLGGENEIKINPLEIRRIKWVKKEDLLRTIEEMGNLSGNYNSVIKSILDDKD